MAGSSSTALDVRRVGEIAQSGYTPDQIDLIRRTIAPGSSADELTLFLSVARELDLNPLLKEVWCVKTLDADGRPKTNRKGEEYPAQIMVGRDGLLTIAERSGHFAGLASGVVKQGDRFNFGLQNPDHEFGDERGKILGGYAYVYRNDRDYPFRVFAEWAEHGAPMTRNAQGERINQWSPWSKYPSSMIRKTAEAQALKLAFRVSGVIAEGEDAPEPVDAAGEPVDAEIVEPEVSLQEESLFDPAAAESGDPQPDEFGDAA